MIIKHSFTYLFLIIQVLFLSTVVLCQYSEDVDKFNWVSEKYNTIIDSVLPISVQNKSLLEFNYEWQFKIRKLPSFDYLNQFMVYIYKE